jgi:DNA excision repair protein ERCC-3
MSQWRGDGLYEEKPKTKPGINLDASKAERKTRQPRDRSPDAVPRKKRDGEVFDGEITARSPHTRHFPDLILSSDAANRPLYVCPDGHIFLETFSPHYRPAYDFLIGIAEPVSRPRFIHEYQITLYSIYAAVSIGLTCNDILRALALLSKCEISNVLKETISSTVNTVGKLKLVLRSNRYFVESTDLALVQRIANDSEMSALRERERNPADMYDEDTGFIIADEEDTGAIIAGIGDSAVYGNTGRLMNELGFDSADIGQEPVIVRRFEVVRGRIRKVRERALQLGLPFTDEYDFRADDRNPSLDINLRQATAIRPYQEKALSKMFGGGRARSGIIVLPCGAGKTLVGITAACTVRKSVIVFCNGSVPVRQWCDQLMLWTTVKEDRIVPLMSKRKRALPEGACILITTYNMLTHSGQRNEETTRILEQIKKREWGLMILDEVQEMPATTFSRVTEVAQAHCKLGLTATLVREDEKISDLSYLIGPKLYEANWIDLSEQGFIARVQCLEIWCKMTGEFYRQYLRASQLGQRRLLSAMNPNKFMSVQRLIDFHESRGDKILVFSDILWVLDKYGKALGKPILSGRASDEEREHWFGRFKTTNTCNCIFISKIGDKAIDLPSANILIQICSHFGSRMQEAQRLGRILRPKAGRTDEYNAFFYTLVSEDTKEMFFSSKRQQFLVDQGYSFEVVQDPEVRWPSTKPLMFSSLDEQKDLLEKCMLADDAAGFLEHIHDEDRDYSVTQEAPAQGRTTTSAELTGSKGQNIYRVVSNR